MKKIFFILLMLAAARLTTWAAGTEIDAVPNVHLVDSTRFVSNTDGVLSAGCVDSLDRMLHRTWQLSTAEPIVVALKDIPDRYEPITYAVELGQKWGVGKSDKDNGLVILLITDRRRMTIAPGYGLEGVLPDIVCNRIIQNYAIPYFKDNNYDGGMIAAVNAVCSILDNPENTGEIASKQPSNRKHGESDFDFFTFMLKCGCVMLAVMLSLVVYSFVSGRKLDEVVRYERLDNLKPVALFLSFLGLGIPLPAYLLCSFWMKRIRNHKRDCPNCGHQMSKLDEETDNQYLTPAQDAEEQLNSVDYDVWLCPNCGEKDVISFVNKKSNLIPCSNCGARACQLTGTRTIRKPTTQSEGTGEKIYYCHNCKKQTRIPYTIAKLDVPPVVIIPGGGGGNGFGGGGGFGGGSFGGGSFGGGGATGGW